MSVTACLFGDGRCAFVLHIIYLCGCQAVVLIMTSSQEYADQHRMSSDVNNKTNFTAINNNPALSASVSDYVSPSPLARASSSTTADQSAAIAANLRTDLADYRGGGSGGTGSAMAAGVTASFRSPKLEPRGASGSGSGSSAKKAQKTSHYIAATGKWRQKMTDVNTSAAGGRSQASDSVR